MFFLVFHLCIDTYLPPTSFFKKIKELFIYFKTLKTIIMIRMSISKKIYCDSPCRYLVESCDFRLTGTRLPSRNVLVPQYKRSPIISLTWVFVLQTVSQPQSHWTELYKLELQQSICYKVERDSIKYYTHIRSYLFHFIAAFLRSWRAIPITSVRPHRLVSSRALFKEQMHVSWLRIGIDQWFLNCKTSEGCSDSSEIWPVFVNNRNFFS